MVCGVMDKQVFPSFFGYVFSFLHRSPQCRIATGYYFSQAFRKMKEYFANPALLEEPPEKILEDPEL